MGAEQPALQQRRDARRINGGEITSLGPRELRRQEPFWKTGPGEYQGQRAALLGQRDTFADASKLRADVSY